MRQFGYTITFAIISSKIEGEGTVSIVVETQAMGATVQTQSLEEALKSLQQQAPNAPFLALGQTVFWDEPMKGGIAAASKRLGYERQFVAGVHDTDYFAKLPAGQHAKGRFKSFPHNDTTTRGLWSAAGEFSALFGSETVVTRELLASGGLNIARLSKKRPEFLDEASEAWGWRGIVSLDDHAPITAQVPIKQLLQELKATFDWALNESLSCIGGQGHEEAETLADTLRTVLCDEAEAGGSVAEFYQRLLPKLYNFAVGRDIEVLATTTSELLKLNPETFSRPRFDLLKLFVEPATRQIATSAYDEAIQGSGLYEMSRFGTGAIPFDLIIPGKGRGTVRIGTRGIVIMTPTPQFISIPSKQPLQTFEDFVRLVCAKFGEGCTVVGKAVTLIGMLAREFVFVFHEGASSYVTRSRKMHQALARQGHNLEVNPILRVKYDAWTALQVSCSWLRLPEPFQRPFGTEELCAPSFAGRWRQVVSEQEDLLAKLGTLRRPLDLIQYLGQTAGGSWNALSRDYDALHEKLVGLKSGIEELRQKRQALYANMKSLKAKRVELERMKGDHFRAKVFEKSPSSEDLAERKRLTSEVESTIHRIAALQNEIAASLHEQKQLVKAPDVLKVHQSRRQIELEVELKRLRLIRQAVTTARGLQRANHRPSAWWFNLVCPDGLWFRETIDTATCYLEPLI